MSLLQQLMDYLSQPPDSIVYHVLTLLALQATLGLAWWQARNNPEDNFARRLAWASGIILLTRLLILLAYFATSGLVEAVAVLPPLERAVDALAAVLLVWALAPQPKGLPHLSSALLLIFAIVIAVMYAAFASEWWTMVEGGALESGYSTTPQAAVWSIFQIAILGVGGVLVVFAREGQWSLRLAILLVFFTAQVLNLVLGGSYGPRDIEVPFWSRLGNVIAFPLLAVLAYRHNLHHLLPSRRLGHSAAQQLAQSIDLSARVTGSLQPKQTIDSALEMVSRLLPARLVAVVQVMEGRPQHLQISAREVESGEQSDGAASSTRTWLLRRDEWPGLSAALTNGQQVELVQDGAGARQLHDLHEELKLDGVGNLLLQPLDLDGKGIGLLLLAGETRSALWSQDEKALSKALSPFLAHSLYNAQRYQLALSGRMPDFERELADLKAALEEAKQQQEAADEQATQLDDQLAVARERLDADHRRLRETTQALALAVQRQTKVRQLEEDLAGLREALSEAELALAYAASGEAGLSTEWVMRTVTRYSGELEEAQAQISALEERLSQPGAQELLERAATISGELRTPLTAVGGYTDLLLDQSTGEISTHQESLLRRMRVNVDNMTHTIESLGAAARSAIPELAIDAQVDVHEAIEAAIYAVSADLQSKRLRLDLFVEEGLPALLDPGNNLHELLTNFFGVACLVAESDSYLQVSVKQVPYLEDRPNGSDRAEFLSVSIGDSGGESSHILYASTLADHGPEAGERSPADSSDLAQYLATISRIAAARGGRSWLDLASPKGSTLILLLPLPLTELDA